MKKKLKKYVRELDQVIITESYDVKLVASITTRLDDITKRSELKHFIATLIVFKNIYTYTASDYKFYDRVISKLNKIIKQ